MAAETSNITVGSSDHVVQFYEHDSKLVEAVGRYLAAAARAGEELADRLVEAEFNADRHAPGQARRLVRAALARWGHSEAFADDVALVVSELASNAVLHAKSPFTVAICAEDSVLRIAVQDGIPLAATVHGGELIPQPMHGLGLIDALSTRWGVESTHDGKVVWAELSYARPPIPRSKADERVCAIIERADLL